MKSSLFILAAGLLLLVSVANAESQPQSKYCKRFEAAVEGSYICEKHVPFFPTYSRCSFSCTDRNHLNVVDCKVQITGKNSYPLCDDLYCTGTPLKSTTAPPITVTATVSTTTSPINQPISSTTNSTDEQSSEESTNESTYAASQTTDEATDESTNVSSTDEPTDEGTITASKEPNDASTDEPVNETISPVDRTTDQSIEETSRGPFDASSNEPTDQSKSTQTTGGSSEQSTTESTNAASQTTDEPTNVSSTDEPTDEGTITASKEPNDASTDEPVNETISPVDRTTDQSIEETSRGPFDASSNEPTDQSENTETTGDQSSADQSVNYSTYDPNYDQPGATNGNDIASTPSSETWTTSDQLNDESINASADEQTESNDHNTDQETDSEPSSTVLPSGATNGHDIVSTSSSEMWTTSDQLTNESTNVSADEPADQSTSHLPHETNVQYTDTSTIDSGITGTHPISWSTTELDPTTDSSTPHYEPNP